MHADRARQIARVLWLTLVLNWSIAFLKILLGLAVHSVMILADGFHSLSDGLSNVVGLVGIRVSSYPADEDHPYGHQKYETLASALIAFFLFVVSIGILRESIRSFVHPRNPEINALSFAIMGATFVVNIFVVLYERKYARRLQSELLTSDSWHTLTDVFITFSVFLALIGIAFKVPYLDSIFSFAIGLVIVVTAVRILKGSSDILCDKVALDPRLIEGVVRRVDGVRDCHEIRTRGRADQVYVDLHVLVDSNMTVVDSHRLANIIEHDIRKEIPCVYDVVVHIEPVSHGHEEIEEVQNH